MPRFDESGKLMHAYGSEVTDAINPGVQSANVISARQLAGLAAELEIPMELQLEHCKDRSLAPRSATFKFLGIRLRR